MEGILLIAVVGLAIALAVALVALRRRATELDVLLGAAMPAAPAPPGPPSPESAAPDPEAVRSESDVATPVAPPAGAATAPDDLLSVGVVHIGPGRRVDVANARAHELLEVAPGRLVGRTVMEAFLDARLDALVDDLVQGVTGTTEARLGGRELRVIVLRLEREADGGTWIALEDVSELRRLQQIRAEFIDNLGHELRTPLSTISLLAETLARDAESAEVPARMRERIAKVEVETGHLAQMVNEMLDLARIEGGPELRLTDDVDLGRLVAASAERLRLFAERQGVRITVHAAPDTPRVRGAEDRLGQVLVNLVHNAVKFSPEGGEVAIDVRPADDEVVVTVADDGIGISRADQARIFERFYKADRARVRGGGTGLGLSIARHVVERHGGRIWVESEEGRGSTFSFAIPVAPRP